MVSTHTPAHRQDGFLFGLAIGSYKRCHWLRKPLAALQLQHFRFKVSRRLLGFRRFILVCVASVGGPTTELAYLSGFTEGRRSATNPQNVTKFWMSSNEELSQEQTYVLAPGEGE